MANTFRKVPHWVVHLSETEQNRYRWGLINTTCKDPDEPCCGEVWGLKGKRAAKKRMARKNRLQSAAVIANDLDEYYDEDQSRETEYYDEVEYKLETDEYYIQYLYNDYNAEVPECYDKFLCDTGYADWCWW